MQHPWVGKVLVVLGQESPRETTIFAIDLPVSFTDVDLIFCDPGFDQLAFGCLLALEGHLIAFLGGKNGLLCPIWW